MSPSKPSIQSFSNSSMAEKTNSEDEVDRLSSLPEPLLVEILSLLPLHSAASTAALSHHWRHLWTQTTSVIIDTADFSNRNFFAVVDHILRQLTSAEIRRFKVRVRKPELVDSSSFWKDFCCCLNPWISHICARNVKMLQVVADNYLGDQMVVSSCVFQSRSLVVLKLGYGFEFEIPDEIHLPNLKKLCVNIEDCHRDLMRRLFRSCPLLEDLELLGTFEEDEHLIDISAPKLTRLIIKAFVLISSIKIKVAIDAPNLKFCSLYDFVGIKYWFVNEPSKSLELYIHGNQRSDYGMSSTLELFQVISSAKSLNIDLGLTCALICLDIDQSLLPMLCNLTSLTLSVCLNFLKALLVLLNLSPNLEFLTMSMIPGLNQHSPRIPSDSVPVCLLRHVKRIEIVVTEMKEFPMELLKYLLGDAAVLERVVVRVTGVKSKGEGIQMDKESKLYEDLCKISTSSSTCWVEFRGIELQQEHLLEV